MVVSFGYALAQTADQELGSTADQTAKFRPLELRGTEVVRVGLDSPKVRPDVSGENREWHEAFAVKVEVTLPDVWGPQVEFFVNESRIDEYGGWENGIYFWVYDPEQLERISGQPISYRFGGTEILQLGTIEMGSPEEIRYVTEDELFKR